jgi:hypothetical protein
VDGAQIENHDVTSLARDGAGIGVLEPIRRQVWRAESVVSGRDVLNVALLVRPVQESNLSIFVVRVVQVDEGAGVPQILMGVKGLVLMHCTPVRTVLVP